MKRSLFFLILFLPLTLLSQDYHQVESIRLSVNPSHIKELSTNMEAHNKKYHGPGPYQAAVFNITAGADAGDLVWMMGPCTYTQLDDRPSEGGHDEDWANNVVPYLNDVSHGEYWRRDKDLVINEPAPETPPRAIYRVRYHHVVKGQSYRVSGLLDKIHATIKSMDQPNYWAVYRNEFRQGWENGRHLVTVTGMDKWSEFDTNTGFRKAFENVHGENTFNNWLDEMDEVFQNVWDEIWTLDKKMSGMEE